MGIDALGKSPEYDPRHASSVRIQVSRLRQKLAACSDRAWIANVWGHGYRVCTPE